MPMNIIIADDHSMIRKGIKLILKTALGYDNIIETGSCTELMAHLRKKECTHLLLDIIFPDGTALEIIPNILKLCPDIRIMMFTMQSPEVYSEVFKQFGINHYLPKSMNEEDTTHYLKKFLNNEPLQPTKTSFTPKNPFAALSPRELEVLHYILNSHPTKSISNILNLRMSTVSTLKKRIYEKTGTDNLTQLLELANMYNINF
jgi:two-component system, NarL family, invasion response regulator UvrY